MAWLAGFGLVVDTCSRITKVLVPNQHKLGTYCPSLWPQNCRGFPSRCLLGALSYNFYFGW